jgi:hypothetical protein
MSSSFGWVGLRNRHAGLRHDPYFRAKGVAAQFKDRQKNQSVFLQNFCFYPGLRRDKI